MDEYGEEEQKQRTDSDDGMRVSIRRSRRRSVCLLDNQFVALYGRHMMDNLLSAMTPQKSLLKVEPRTVALKQDRDRSNGNSHRPSLLSRLSLISRTSIRTSILSSHTPSFFGSCGSRKSSLTSSATGWLSSGSGKWLAREVDVATLGNVMAALGDSLA